MDVDRPISTATFPDALDAIGEGSECTSDNRCHHLLKTFWNGWNGLKGWRDRQLPDGTIVWTLPTGHTYTTYPGSKHLFPKLCEHTATLWPGEPPVVEATGDRGVMMPKRRHTRGHIAAKRLRPNADSTTPTSPNVTSRRRSDRGR